MLVLTGPTGNVGAEVCRMLMEHPDPPDFRIGAHRPGTIRERFGDEAPVVALDYDDPTTYGPVLEGVRQLFLLFPLPSPRTVNTRMKPFIDAAVAAGVEHIVYISVPGSDHLKVVPHYHVERHIEASGADFTILRCSYFMQNLTRVVSTHGVDIIEHGEVFIPAGDGTISFIDSRDVAEVVLDVLAHPDEHRNEHYLLTGPERLTFYDVADILSEVLERPIEYAKPSFPAFWWRMTRRGLTWDMTAFMTIVYVLSRFDKNAPLTEQLPKLLGRPARRFPEFAQDYRWRWEQQAWT